MDKVHDISDKPWICKNRIVIKEAILQRLASYAQLNANQPVQNSDIVDNERDKELTNVVENFIESNQDDVKPYFLYNLTDERNLTQNKLCDLNLFNHQLEHAKKMINDRTYKANYMSRLTSTRRDLLMRQLALFNRPSESATPSSNSSDPFVGVLVVQLWPQPSKTTKCRLEKEILFRVDQSLTDLRDQIKCQRDYGVPIDLSEDPHQERVFRGELFKSGFFLIDDTFYSDMRDPNNSDLSNAIIEWSKNEFATIDDDGNNVKVGSGIGPFYQQRMELFKFEDLKIQLGRPYLYLHQGNCEHLFTITDLKYVTNDLNLQKTQFPFVTAMSFGSKADNLKCYICKSRPPHWYTRGNKRLPVDPYFFCENCFHSFNYDSEQRKIGQFQAYLYTSAVGIPDSVIMSSSGNSKNKTIVSKV